jgi:glutamate-ammonia-ligase adenylyltransferase
VNFQSELNHLECASPAMRDALRGHPEWVVWLKQRIEAARHPDPAQDWQDWLAETGRAAETLASLRTFRQRELIEIALRDLSGVASFEETVARLSQLAEWVISVVLVASWDAMAAKMSPPVKSRQGFAVIAVGKLGAAELNYSSDVDLIFYRRT